MEELSSVVYYSFINPWECKRVTVVVLRVCVCYGASCYIPCLYVENALFDSYGDICLSPLLSSLLDQFSMDKRDIYIHVAMAPFQEDQYAGLTTVLIT